MFNVIFIFYILSSFCQVSKISFCSLYFLKNFVLDFFKQKPSQYLFFRSYHCAHLELLELRETNGGHVSFPICFTLVKLYLICSSTLPSKLCQLQVTFSQPTIWSLFGFHRPWKYLFQIFICFYAIMPPI